MWLYLNVVIIFYCVTKSLFHWDFTFGIKLNAHTTADSDWIFGALLLADSSGASVVVVVGSDVVVSTDVATMGAASMRVRVSVCSNALKKI